MCWAWLLDLRVGYLLSHGNGGGSPCVPIRRPPFTGGDSYIFCARDVVLVYVWFWLLLFILEWDVRYRSVVGLMV